MFQCRAFLPKEKKIRKKPLKFWIYFEIYNKFSHTDLHSFLVAWLKQAYAFPSRWHNLLLAPINLDWGKVLLLLGLVVFLCLDREAERDRETGLVYELTIELLCVTGERLAAKAADTLDGNIGVPIKGATRRTFGTSDPDLEDGIINQVNLSQKSNFWNK